MPTRIWTAYLRTYSARCEARRGPAPLRRAPWPQGAFQLADRIQQPRAYLLQPPPGERVRFALPQGERLQLAARRQNLGAQPKFGGARIGYMNQTIEERFLRNRGTGILAGLRVAFRRARCAIQRVEQRIRKLFLQRLYRVEIRERSRVGLRDRKNGGIGQNPGPRQITLASNPFAPYGNRLGAGAGRRRQLPHAAQPLPCKSRVRFIQPPVLEGQAFLAHPLLTAERAQALGELGRNRLEVQNIVPGIFQLRARQRPHRPIGARLALGYGYIKQSLHELRVADLGPESDAGGRYLRVEDRGHHELAGQVDRLEILASGVNEFARLRRGEGRHQWFEAAHPQRVDQPYLSRRAELQQAQLGKESAFAQEFGIDADRHLRLQCARKRRELIAAIDPNRVSHRSSECTIWNEL